ncbi:uncharacterized protein [Nicotiana sylvestris]|uniref:uncharacterized protein n=1 Tax=Nicotiana sylvestris TaxID=4096 RepID=UPI00388C5D1E
MLRKCPHHDIPERIQLYIFYHGLKPSSRNVIDAAVGSSIMGKTTEEALQLLNEISENAIQWPSERVIIKKVATVNQIQGPLPSNTEKNPKENLKAIALRPGTTLDEPYTNKQEKNQSEEQVDKGEMMKREKLDNQFAKFLEISKQTHINIPFTDALLQMPSYAKFLKEIFSSKRKLEEVSMVMLTKKCSAILQNKLPQELGDPDHGEMKYIGVSLQFADQNFIVVEMKECPDEPIIFGKPFLATGREIIDVHQGQLILRVDEERVIFDMPKILRFPEDDTSSSCFSIDMINNLIDEFKNDQLISNSMERCLAKSGTTQDEDPTIRNDAKLLEKDYEEGGMQ